MPAYDSHATRPPRGALVAAIPRVAFLLLCITPLATQATEVASGRSLLDHPDEAGEFACRVRNDLCIGDATYYVEKVGLVNQFRAQYDKTVECQLQHVVTNDTTGEIIGCQPPSVFTWCAPAEYTGEDDEQLFACANPEATVTLESVSSFEDVDDRFPGTTAVTDFNEQCPLSEQIESVINRYDNGECRDFWNGAIFFVGCVECEADISFFAENVQPACAASPINECATTAGSEAAAAIIDEYVNSAVESSPEESSISTGGVVAIVLISLALAGASVYGVAWYRRKQAERAAAAAIGAPYNPYGESDPSLMHKTGYPIKQHAYHAGGVPTPYSYGGSTAGSSPYPGPQRQPSRGSQPSMYASGSSHSPYSGHSLNDRTNATYVTHLPGTGFTYGGYVPPPPEGVRVAELTEESTAAQILDAQLDWVTEALAGHINRFVRLVGRHGRRLGGQGAVAFAQHANNESRELAIKFYFDDRAFRREADISTLQGIKDVMPPVFSIEDSLEKRSTEAFPEPLNMCPLPPMIIVEKGESLDEFIDRKAPDFFTSLQFLVHIGRKLETLHKAGWVHRDVKPPNTIWLPSQNEWALIDFGCAAQVGEEAEMCFSLYYAPPEIILAYKAGQKTLVADASADVWSLGIMCFELLTGSKFHGERADMKSVIAKLVGEEKIATEDDLSTEIRRKLGAKAFRDSVIQMLSRDPSKRPTMTQALADWTSIFQQNTIT